jgi:ATP-dependent 26S proteasome regulatory subunit
VDVLFILSTNRPDRLEPALTARPGRIDQALEFPLPNADGRRRLLARYGQGLNLRTADLDDMVLRTAGASPAFIRELLRKAALLAAAETPTSPDLPALTSTHLRDALRAIVEEGGDLTQRLLGAGALSAPGEG